MRPEVGLGLEVRQVAWLELGGLELGLSRQMFAHDIRRRCVVHKDAQSKSPQRHDPGVGAVVPRGDCCSQYAVRPLWFPNAP